jgi:hypothetical protein
MRSHRIAFAAAALACAGCAASPGPNDPRPGPQVAVVILQGSAFDTSDAREETSRVVAETTGLMVRLVTQEPAMERVTQPAASRFDRSVAAAARTDALSVSCRKKSRSIVTAVAERAAMIVRIRLDAKTKSRRASPADRATLARKSGAAGVFTALGLGGDTVHETTLDGTVERTTFPGVTTTVRKKAHTAERRLAARDDAAPRPLREALAPALAAMPPPKANRWDVVARGLVTGGCPVLGAAVADVFLDDGAAKHRIRTAAVGVLHGASAKREEPSTSTASVEADATGVDSPTSEASAETAVNPADPTCAVLCSLQMVQLCNNDRALWNQHGSRWQSTRCGTRRSETFLADCYRMQWLSGTYDRACIRPCEDTADARSRLVAVLRRSGCLLRPATS